MKTVLLAFALAITLQAYSQSDSSKAKSDTTRQIFMKVEIQASINRTVWTEYINKAIKPYLDSARAKGMPPGTYPVKVKFLVEVDGSISDATALEDPGYGLAAGAVNIMRKSPKWDPCIQNGRKVRSYRTQIISFVLPK